MAITTTQVEPYVPSTGFAWLCYQPFHMEDIVLRRIGRGEVACPIAVSEQRFHRLSGPNSRSPTPVFQLVCWLGLSLSCSNHRSCATIAKLVRLKLRQGFRAGAQVGPPGPQDRRAPLQGAASPPGACAFRRAHEGLSGQLFGADGFRFSDAFMDATWRAAFYHRLVPMRRC